MVAILIVFSCFLTSVCAFLEQGTGPSSSPGPVVHTNCGPVQGQTQNGAYSFRGIPYALPPVGTKRWKEPEPLNNRTGSCWKGIYQAANFGNTCIQRSFLNSSEIMGHEDCLYLNVWTPSIGQKLLPVMVWIHGGFLLYLNGNYPTYSPDETLAAETNVIYVSMNYRLNAFGFMTLDILSNASTSGTSGNYGFMDQILALQWVQQNIRQFGGDPNKVTIFGQSSGGTSIFALLAVPRAAGLFQRAWLLSASPILNKTASDAAKDNEVFLRNTGCSNVSCLYSLGAEAIIKAIPWDEYPHWAMTDQGDLPVKGYFDGAIAVVDGVLIPKSPFDAWKAGEGIDVPLLIGTTAQEIDFDPTQTDLNRWNWTIYEQRVREKLDTFGDDISETALKLYPTGIVTPEYQYTSMISDLRVTCGNDVLARHASSSFRSPVFRYVVTARPAQPVHLIGISFPASYSCHLWDALAYFDTIKDYYTPTENDKRFTETIRKEILSFVNTGRPLSAAWKVYDSTTALLNANITYTTRYQNEKCSFWISKNFYSYSWIN